MSRYYRKDTKDANHDQICAHLRSHGVTVMELERPLDLLLYYRGWTGWAEIKTQDRNAEIRRGQLEFMAETPMQVAFVKSENEAWDFVKTGIGLSDAQKNRLIGFLLRDSRSRYWPAIVEKVLNGE
jgi:hypothetical protein